MAEHILDRARRTWHEWYGGEAPKKQKAQGSVRLRRVEHPKKEATIESARAELEDMGFEVSQPKPASKAQGDLYYLEAALRPLVERQSTGRIRMILIDLIEKRGFERAESLINESDLRFQLMALCPDIFR